jgi:hypothetical protein
VRNFKNKIEKEAKYDEAKRLTVKYTMEDNEFATRLNTLPSFPPLFVVVLEKSSRQM